MLGWGYAATTHTYCCAGTIRRMNLPLELGCAEAPLHTIVAGTGAFVVAADGL